MKFTALAQWLYKKYLPQIIGIMVLSLIVSGLLNPKSIHHSNPNYGDDAEYYQSH